MDIAFAEGQSRHLHIAGQPGARCLQPSSQSLIQFFYFFKYTLGFYVFGWFITAYPYVLAYLYCRRNREETSRVTFDAIRARRPSNF